MKNGSLVNIGMSLSKFSKPLVSQPLSCLPRLEPDSIKISLIAHVFGNGYSVVKVYDGVPPSTWDEHRLSRILDALDNRVEFTV